MKRWTVWWSLFHFCILASITPVNAEEIRDYYAEPGLNPFKETLVDLNDSIDPFSGTLQIKHTDITVPGNGLDIHITRTYTSWQERFGVGLSNPYGTGWTIHFGRVLTSSKHVAKICNQSTFSVHTGDNPSLELPDGGREILVLADPLTFPKLTAGELITRSNWRAQCDGTGFVVTSPEGIVYTMNERANVTNGNVTEPSWYTTKIQDVSGNSINITYITTAAGHKLIDKVNASDGRSVTFTYTADQKALKSISSNTQTWHYDYLHATHGTEERVYLQRVRRPDGLSWKYAYYPETALAGRHSLQQVTYPNGGTVDYTYKIVRFGTEDIGTTAVLTKKIGGRGVTPGTWTYTYEPQSKTVKLENPIDGITTGKLDVTTVKTPNAIYKYFHAGVWWTQGISFIVYFDPSLIGMQVGRETYDLNSILTESASNRWGTRKISTENYRVSRGRDQLDGTFAPYLIETIINRENGGNKITYTDYDAYGNVGKKVETSDTAGDTDRETIHTYFLNVDRWIVNRVEDETVNQVRLCAATYCSKPNLAIDRTYDIRGFLIAENKYGVNTRYEYHPNGELKRIIHANDATIEYQSYFRGTAQVEIYTDKSTAGTVLKQLSRKVNSTGTVASTTDARGNIARYQYDRLNRPISVDYPLGDDITLAYSTTTRTLTRGTFQQVDTLDGLGQVVAVEHRDLTPGAVQSIVVNRSYDALGQKTFESYPNSATGTSFQYDQLGRMTRMEHPDKSFRQWEYGNPSTQYVNETDENGNLTTRYYRAYGHPDAKTLLWIRTPANTTDMEKNRLDITLQIFQGTETTPGTVNGQAIDYTYNDHLYLINMNRLETSSTFYSRDILGNMTGRQVASSKINYRYDALNRLTKIDYTDQPTADTVFTYDGDDNIETITRQVPANGDAHSNQLIYTYDANNNLDTETLVVFKDTIEAKRYVTDYHYNTLDQITQVTYPLGRVVDFAPDSLGRPGKIGTFASQLKYHPSGQIQQYLLGNGVTVSNTLTPRLLLASIATGTLQDINYAYDNSGNLVSATDKVVPTNSLSAMTYDGLNRLLTVSGAFGTAGYTYTDRSQIASHTLTTIDNSLTHTYAFSKDRLKTVKREEGTPLKHTQTILLSYDSYGNVTARARDLRIMGVAEAATFTYSTASQLLKAHMKKRFNFGGSVVLADKIYRYDGNGQRIFAKDNLAGVPSYFVYNKAGKLLQEQNMEHCVSTDYIYLGAVLLAKEDRSIATNDGDLDGIPDCYEELHGMHPGNAQDATLDFDNDGLNNLGEYKAGTDPRNADTDNDGITDNYEVIHGLDPLINDASGDLDGDGFSNLDEFELGSSVSDHTSTPPVKQPLISITTPAPTGVITHGEKVSLQATASDWRGRNVSAAILWRSSIDGILKYPSSGLSIPLSEGTHTVTAEYTDHVGHDKILVADSVVVEVARHTLIPYVFLRFPESHTTVSDTSQLFFEGIAHDPQDGKLFVRLTYEAVNGNAHGLLSSHAHINEGDIIKEPKIPPGDYDIEAYTNDKNGHRFEDIVRITVVSNVGDMPVFDDYSQHYVAQRTYYEGETIPLTWGASDTEDGNISHNQLWFAAEIGDIEETRFIGTGANVDADLPPGSYNFFVVVKDSDHNQIAKKIRSIEILPRGTDAPPNIELAIPQAFDSTFYIPEATGDNFELTDLHLAALATDPEDGDLTASLKWEYHYKDYGFGGKCCINKTVVQSGSSVDMQLPKNRKIPRPRKSSQDLLLVVLSVTDKSGSKREFHILVKETILPLTAGNNQPTLTIESPTAGLHVPAGQAIALNARAGDIQDGDLSTQIEWHSSREGPLGTGANQSVVLSQAGDHIIVASVTDKDGIIRRRSVRITVQGKSPLLSGAEPLFELSTSAKTR